MFYFENKKFNHFFYFSNSFVTNYIPRPLRNNSGKDKKDQYTNIYLKQLRRDITPAEFEEAVTKLTADIGKITSAKLMTDSVDGKEVSKGFGFANFDNHDAAAKALERYQDTEYVKAHAPELLGDEQSLYANVAKTKEERRQQLPQNTNLYVKNIVESVTKEQFQELFEYGPGGKKDNPEKKFGKITSACIMTDDKGAPRGFGFACYETKEAATKALHDMNGYILEGKPLYVAIAQPKEERRRQLQQQFSRPGIPGPMPHMGAMFHPGYYPLQRGYPPPGAMPRNPNPQQFRGGARPVFSVGGRTHQSMPRGAPVGAVGANPAAAYQSIFLEFIKQFPEDEVNGKLQDMLHDAFANEVKDQYTLKHIVGSILSKTNGKTLQQAFDFVLPYLSDANVRRGAVQSVQQSLQNAH